MPAVGKAGHLFAHLGHPLQIDIDETQSGLLSAHVEQHFAPRIHHQAVTIGPAAVLVLANLRRGHDESARLDGAGALQHLPMRGAGRYGKAAGMAMQSQCARPSASNKAGKRMS